MKPLKLFDLKNCLEEIDESRNGSMKVYGYRNKKYYPIISITVACDTPKLMLGKDKDSKPLTTKQAIDELEATIKLANDANLTLSNVCIEDEEIHCVGTSTLKETDESVALIV